MKSKLEILAEATESFMDLQEIMKIMEKYDLQTKKAMWCTLFTFICDRHKLDKLDTLIDLASTIYMLEVETE